MNLADLYEKPLSEIVKQMQLSDLKVHSNDDGHIESVELKFKNEENKTLIPERPMF